MLVPTYVRSATDSPRTLQNTYYQGAERYFKSYKFNNSEPCGTRNPKTPVGIGRITGCLLKRNLLQSLSTIHSYGSHKHKHTPCRAASYRLSWPVEVPRIDDTPHSPNRYTTRQLVLLYLQVEIQCVRSRISIRLLRLVICCRLAVRSSTVDGGRQPSSGSIPIM